MATREGRRGREAFVRLCRVLLATCIHTYRKKRGKRTPPWLIFVDMFLDSGEDAKNILEYKVVGDFSSKPNYLFAGVCTAPVEWRKAFPEISRRGRVYYGMIRRHAWWNEMARGN